LHTDGSQLLGIEWGLPAGAAAGFYLNTATFRALVERQLSVDESINSGRLVVEGTPARMAELVGVINQVVGEHNGSQRAKQAVN
jgi:hypothetical protein